MDNLQCGQCGSIFHKLDLFIEHKRRPCFSEKPSTSLTPARKIASVGPRRFRPLGKLQGLGSNSEEYPLKYKDISSYIIKKELHRDEGFDFKYEKLYLKRKLLAALPKGYCGECTACLKAKNCGQCASCLERDTMVGPQSRKRCLLRVCHSLSTTRVFHVESLIDKQEVDGRVEFLVKWRGYPSSENSWEPESHILSKSLIEEFKTRMESGMELPPAKRFKSSTGLQDPAKDLDPAERIAKILEQEVDSFINLEATLSKDVEAKLQKEGREIPTELPTAEFEPPATEPEKTVQLTDTAASVEQPIQPAVEEEKKLEPESALPILEENPNLLEIKQFLSEALEPEQTQPTVAPAQTSTASPTNDAIKMSDELKTKKRGARKSMKSSVTRLTRREIEAILEDLKKDKVKNESDPDTGEIMDGQSETAYGGPAPRAGRTTKQAALNFIRSVCNRAPETGGSRLEIEDDSDEDSYYRGESKATDSYETNLDLSGASSVMYIPAPGEQGKFILVKGDQDEISLLEGANLSPKVLVMSKEALRKATPIATAEDILQMEQEEEQRRFARELEAEFFADSPEYFSDGYMDYEEDLPLEEKINRHPIKREFVVEKKLPNPYKKKPGRPKKTEAQKREMQQVVITPVVETPPVLELPLGAQGIVGLVTRRRPGKPKKFSEYIDPDTLLEEGDKEDETRVKEEPGSGVDDDFTPKLPFKSSGRPRGRPPKHYNINDITDENDFKRKFSKTAPPKASDLKGKGKKNRVFVVMPDGTMVEVSGNDREKAIARATAKMDVIRKHAPTKIADDGKAGGNRSDLRPLLEECTMDLGNEASTLKLPNTVQLVESELPLTEAENSEALVGMYLFRQIYSPNDSNLSCRMCKAKAPIRYPVDLEKHYHVIHEIGVQIFKAEFSESVVFVCVPSDVAEDTILNSGCRFCDLTLKTLSEVREHYPADHNKDVRLVPETAVMELSDKFYCSICSHPSSDFTTHHQHMKSEHKMQTFSCKYCNFCTPRPGRLRTHVKQRHMQDQPGPNLQCSVCSVFVHGRERLNKHILLSHAVQTGAKTWSCAKCLQPCGDAKSLMAHIQECPYLIGSTKDQSSSINQQPLFKCNNCSLSFATQQEVEKHMLEENHSGAEEPVALPVRVEGESTCFLCNMKFASNETCSLHQHHVHMRWVAKALHDYSEPPQIKGIGEEKGSEEGSEYLLDPVTGLKVKADGVAKSDSELIQELENELMDNLKKDNQQIVKKDDGKVTLSSSKILDIGDLPSNERLSELGFPTKIGHYCHLCDAVIKSYTLFYLHMHNLHGLEKRFQCVLTHCSQTFKDEAIFQEHSLVHDQKSEHFCSMCDCVLGHYEELQDHMLSPDHATKYMKIQEKYNRSEPRNYRCKVCHSWFGLFATFVKHMETESHQYQCQHCGLLFVQPGPRRNHIQSVHPELANICEICGARLQNSQALWSHLSLHSIVYECEKCHRRFLQKEQLTAHMEIHAPPTPCPWEGCSRKLSTKVGLYNHLRMHRGETDFKCKICNKGFFKKKALETHLKTHEIKQPNIQRKGRITTTQSVLISNNTDKDLGPQLAATNVEMIQLICAGCLNGFDSEERFSEHICTGHAMSETGQAEGALPQESILPGNSEENSQTFSLAGNEGDQLMTDEELAAQLAQAVAEATAPGETFTSSSTVQTVTMSDGSVLTLAAAEEEEDVVKEELNDRQEEEETVDALMIADSVGQEGMPEELNQEQFVLIQDPNVEEGQTEDKETTLFLTEEEALLAAQSGQLRDNGDGTLVMHHQPQMEGMEEEGTIVMHGGEGSEEGIVMMVDEDGNGQHIMDGDQPYRVMKVPTADGGEQVLLIPLNTEGGNTVLTLPPNMVLSETGEGEEMTVSFQTEGDGVLTLAEGEELTLAEGEELALAEGEEQQTYMEAQDMEELLVQQAQQETLMEELNP